MRRPERNARGLPLAGAAALAAALALALATTPAHAFAIRGGVVSNGSSNPATGGGRMLFGTLGQAGIGQSAGASFKLCHGFWCFGGSRVLAVDGPPDGDHGPALPLELAIGPPSPNPSRGQTSFSLTLPHAARVTFAVFDVAGRQVGDEAVVPFEAGYHRLSWSAPAEHAGVYFAQIEVDGAVRATKRIVLVR